MVSVYISSEYRYLGGRGLSHYYPHRAVSTDRPRYLVGGVYPTTLAHNLLICGFSHKRNQLQHRSLFVASPSDYESRRISICYQCPFQAEISTFSFPKLRRKMCTPTARCLHIVPVSGWGGPTPLGVRYNTLLALTRRDCRWCRSSSCYSYTSYTARNRRTNVRAGIEKNQTVRYYSKSIYHSRI